MNREGPPNEKGAPESAGDGAGSSGCRSSHESGEGQLSLDATPSAGIHLPKGNHPSQSSSDRPAAGNPQPIPEPIDTLESLRFDPSKLKKAARKLLNTVPVRKPNKQEFIRVHPGEDHRMLAALITLEEDRDRETFLVHPSFVQELDQEIYTVNTLFLAVTRSKVAFLWPVKVPGQNGKVYEWHTSAQAAAEMAMRHWIRVSANKHRGAYEIFEAVCQVSEPEWPEVGFEEILRIAFRDRIIRDQDHPVMKKLRGELI